MYAGLPSEFERQTLITFTVDEEAGLLYVVQADKTQSKTNVNKFQFLPGTPTAHVKEICMSVKYETSMACLFCLVRNCYHGLFHG